MKKIGKITKYNNEYGEITTANEIVDFSKKDISNEESNEETINIYDIVEFRLESKFPNIYIARNIKKIDFND